MKGGGTKDGDEPMDAPGKLKTLHTGSFSEWYVSFWRTCGL